MMDSTAVSPITCLPVVLRAVSSRSDTNSNKVITKQSLRESPTRSKRRVRLHCRCVWRSAAIRSRVRCLHALHLYQFGSTVSGLADTIYLSHVGPALSIGRVGGRRGKTCCRNRVAGGHQISTRERACANGPCQGFDREADRRPRCTAARCVIGEWRSCYSRSGVRRQGRCKRRPRPHSESPACRSALRTLLPRKLRCSSISSLSPAGDRIGPPASDIRKIQGRCATANGWSIASARSRDRRRCCAISPATPTGSPSQTDAWSHATRKALPSSGRTTGSKVARAIR
jgi:hypothetical protein